MRIVFQLYSIFFTGICVLLTGSQGVGVSEKWIEAIIRTIINTIYLVFGPVLLMLSIIGLRNTSKLSMLCNPNGKADILSPGYIVLLMFSMFYSCIVTIIMVLEKTLNMAKASLEDPNCLTYKLIQKYRNFYSVLNRPRSSNYDQNSQA